MHDLRRLITVLSKNKRASPLVEESILLGLTLFVFMVIAAIIFDLVEFAKNIFSNVVDFTDNIP